MWHGPTTSSDLRRDSPGPTPCSWLTVSSLAYAVAALTGVAGRLLQNFVETYPLFAAAVLTAHAAAIHSWVTDWGVQHYFWGRVAYLAIYAAGVFLLRSLVWNVAALGI